MGTMSVNYLRVAKNMLVRREKVLKPFLRWAGGKTWFLKHIDRFLPNSINNYYEPFLGGGAVFLYLKSNNLIKGKCKLSDSNEELINLYQVLKDEPNELFQLLGKQKNTEEYYYKIRKQKTEDKLVRAANFFFLNRTSFNGIYRVNKQGEYNVPFGYRTFESLYNFDELTEVSALLKGCEFSVRDFNEALKYPRKGDLVFLDPPYTVAHENNGFIHYNQSLFSWENQVQLSESVKLLRTKNVNFILTNALHVSIRSLYENIGKSEVLERSSTIGGLGAQRKKYREFVLIS